MLRSHWNPCSVFQAALPNWHHSVCPVFPLTSCFPAWFVEGASLFPLGLQQLLVTHSPGPGFCVVTRCLNRSKRLGWEPGDRGIHIRFGSGWNFTTLLCTEFQGFTEMGQKVLRGMQRGGSRQLCCLTVQMFVNKVARKVQDEVVQSWWGAGGIQGFAQWDIGRCIAASTMTGSEDLSMCPLEAYLGEG